jgi:hypothetical protein
MTARKRAQRGFVIQVRVSEDEERQTRAIVRARGLDFVSDALRQLVAEEYARISKAQRVGA